MVMRPQEEESSSVPVSVDVLLTWWSESNFSSGPLKSPWTPFCGVEHSCACLWIARCPTLPVYKLSTINVMIALYGTALLIKLCFTDSKFLVFEVLQTFLKFCILLGIAWYMSLRTEGKYETILLRVLDV